MLEVEPVMDPVATYEARTAAIELSRRPESLESKSVVLFNNGKLRPDFGNAKEMYEILKTLFARLNVKSCIDLSEDLVPLRPSELNETISKIVDIKADAIVLALCEGGAGIFNTVYLALELEKVGVPTITLATRTSVSAAVAIARPRISCLPVCAVRDDVFTAPSDEIRSMMGNLFPDIIMALTGPVEDINRKFASEKWLGR